MKGIWRLVTLLIGLGLWLAGENRVLSKAEQSVCAADNAKVWAEAMTAQLPLFANLELTRQGSSYHLVLVGFPELEPISADEQQILGETEQAVRLYFTTLERRLVQGSNPNIPATGSLEGRATETLQLAYRGIIVRRAGDPWQLYSLQMIGSHLPMQDISQGAVAQGIQAWVRAGCPLPSDLELSKPAL